MVRIVHVSDCYPPRTGGIETQVRDLARAQVAAGHEVHVLTATRGVAGERGGAVEDDDGVRVHRLGARVPFDLPVNPAAPPRMREVLAQVRPDVVHVHAGVVSPFAFDGARVAVGGGWATAITWHCMLDGTVPVLRRLVRATSWRHAPVALSAVSRAAAQRVAEVFDVPVEVVPNGVDLTRWSPAPAGPPSGAPSGAPLRCVATMRLAPRKRALALVGLVEDAVGQLEPGSLTLDLVGDGPVRPLVEQAVRRRGLADVVTVHGRLPREELAARYADAEVFVAPATLEAFGIAALEARASGLVVVARRGTGIEGFVTHGVDGVLVDDDACMARWLVRLASDPGLLVGLLDAARTTRPEAGWSVTLRAAEAEYVRAARLREVTTAVGRS